jgi:hypothetical protein
LSRKRSRWRRRLRKKKGRKGSLNDEETKWRKDLFSKVTLEKGEGIGERDTADKSDYSLLSLSFMWLSGISFAISYESSQGKTTSSSFEKTIMTQVFVKKKSLLLLSVREWKRDRKWRERERERDKLEKFKCSSNEAFDENPPS